LSSQIVFLASRSTLTNGPKFCDHLYIGAETETVNLVIGLILIVVLFLDRQLNIKGKEALKI